MINLEFTSIRKEWYNYTLGTISLHSKYNAKTDYDKFKKFDSKNLLLLSREELLILFSYKDHLIDNLKLLKSIPEFEVGYGLGLDNDPYEQAFCKWQKDNIIKGLTQNYSFSNILFRQHPQSKTPLGKECIIDNSEYARKFISKCDKIICNISNLGYEGMLFSRKVSHLNKNFITSFGEEYDFSLLNDEIVSLEKLNFITFVLYSPFSLMFNKDYIYKIIQNKLTTEELYSLNQAKIFSDFGLNLEHFKKLNRIEKKEYLLRRIHHFNNDDIHYIENILYNRTEKEKYNNLVEENIKLDNINNFLNIENKELQTNLDYIKKQNKILLKKDKDKENIIREYKLNNIKIIEELNKVYNSKSWKLTRPLRIISNKLKGKHK